MKTILIFILMFGTSVMAQTEVIYSNGSKSYVNIKKVTRKKVVHTTPSGDKTIQTSSVDSIHCNTSKVTYYETGGKELKEFMLLSLTVSSVSLIPTEKEIFTVGKAGVVVATSIVSVAKFLIGSIKIQHYEPKPATQMVMIRYVYPN